MVVAESAMLPLRLAESTPRKMPSPASISIARDARRMLAGVRSAMIVETGFSSLNELPKSKVTTPFR